MDYAMLTSGLALLTTCTLGNVARDIGSKLLFRMIPLVAAVILIINSLNNLNVI
jgi:hypothetical protein